MTLPRLTALLTLAAAVPALMPAPLAAQQVAPSLPGGRRATPPPCPAVSLSPATAEVEVGEVLQFDVIADFTCDPTVGGSIDVVWDPGFFEFVAWQLLSPADALVERQGDVNAELGVIDAAGFIVSLLPTRPFAGPATIGSLVLRPTRSGQSTVTVGGDDTVPPETFGPWFSARPGFPELTVNYAGAQVQAGARTPLPAWATMLLGALCLAIAARVTVPPLRAMRRA